MASALCLALLETVQIVLKSIIVYWNQVGLSRNFKVLYFLNSPVPKKNPLTHCQISYTIFIVQKNWLRSDRPFLYIARWKENGNAETH